MAQTKFPNGVITWASCYRGVYNCDTTEYGLPCSLFSPCQEFFADYVSRLTIFIYFFQLEFMLQSFMEQRALCSVFYTGQP